MPHIIMDIDEPSSEARIGVTNVSGSFLPHSVPVGDNRRVLWGTNIDIDEVRMRFKNFLLGFIPPEEMSDDPFYITSLSSINDTAMYTLDVDCDHIFQFDRELYQQLVNYPSDTIPILDLAVSELFKEIYHPPEDVRIQTRPSHLRTVSQIRDLGPDKIDSLISVRGIVIRASDIIPDMRIADFRCAQCGRRESISLERGKVEEPNSCTRCLAKYSFQLMHSTSSFSNKQHIKLQETPENIPEGEVPHTIHLCAYDSLVDAVRPGDRVEVTGIFRASPLRVSRLRRTVKSVYSTFVDIVCFDRLKGGTFVHEEEEQTEFTEEMQQRFRELSARPDLYDLLIKSFAPSIWECDDIKKGLLCQLFGGVNQNFVLSGRGRFRGELNVLLVGDPSTAKSQLLQFVHKIAHRGIYTSGKGSSAVGLTVYVKKDPETREIVLESGALVLSDRGICCIDEFDKMDDNTRAMLHEVMEQQTLSVAKAGIICQLNARTAILAAANPKQSRYNPKLSVVENIELPPTLLSRFDLIYLMLDTTTESYDKRLAKHILSMYSGETHTDQPTGIIPRELLAGYISYARKNCKPVLSEEAGEKLTSTYVEMRKVGNSRKTITATPRQLESLIRIATALAKLRLSNEVVLDDVDEAIRLMKVATQQAATDPKTGQIDMDLLQTGITATSRLRVQEMASVLRQILGENREAARKGMRNRTLFEELKKRMEALGVSVTDTEFVEVLSVLSDEGIIVTSGKRQGVIRLVIG